MTTAPDYNRVFSFTNFQSANPATPLPGNEVDAELNAVKATTDAINTNLQLIQRNDGQLANASVGYQQLQSAVLTGMNPPTMWSGAGINYVVGALVFFGTQLYVCNTAHTSTSIRPPSSNPAWTFLVDFLGISVPDGSLTSAAFSAGCVGAVALADGGVIASKLAPGAVTTDAIADGAVTVAKLDLSGLPTVLPAASGVLWNNGGALSIS